MKNVASSMSDTRTCICTKAIQDVFILVLIVLGKEIYRRLISKNMYILVQETYKSKNSTEYTMRKNILKLQRYRKSSRVLNISSASIQYVHKISTKLKNSKGIIRK